MVASVNGSFNGVAPPPFQTSKLYKPHYMTNDGGAVTLTANRLYRCWFYVPSPTTFLGGWFYNSGAADNGKNVRIGVWDKSGTLEKDFGQTTLTGAAAIRQAANSVSLPGGWHQVGLVADTTPALYGMQPYSNSTDVGYIPAPITEAFGLYSVTVASGGQNAPVGDYAAFTYGALPSTLTTATNTITTNNGVANKFPMMGLYL